MADRQEIERRWTIWQPADGEDVPPSPGPMVIRIYAGPTLAPGEKLELVERDSCHLAALQQAEDRLRERLIRVRGHLEGYADILAVTPNIDREALVEGLREDAAALDSKDPDREEER